LVLIMLDLVLSFAGELLIRTEEMLSDMLLRFLPKKDLNKSKKRLKF